MKGRKGQNKRILILHFECLKRAVAAQSMPVPPYHMVLADFAVLPGKYFDAIRAHMLPSLLSMRARMYSSCKLHGSLLMPSLQMHECVCMGRAISGQFLADSLFSLVRIREQLRCTDTCNPGRSETHQRSYWNLSRHCSDERPFRRRSATLSQK